jgi:hypothetical protein
MTDLDLDMCTGSAPKDVSYWLILRQTSSKSQKTIV